MRIAITLPPGVPVPPAAGFHAAGNTHCRRFVGAPRRRGANLDAARRRAGNFDA